ncbi:MAG: flagellar export chaperone FliS [Bryobacterales bacterium]|nr:flagellar export chaperone FliS [Bryobacterales bacterium]
MTRNPDQLYLESTIYTSTPEQLIQLLYETAIEAIRWGIDAVERGDIEARARAITKASSCVMELAGSLNVEAGGELGVRLAVLYEYLLHELLEANIRQSVKPLRDCERVLCSLMDGWAAVIQQLEHNAAEAREISGAPATISSETQEPARAPADHPHALPAADSGSEEPDPFDIDTLEPAVNSVCG